jgi:hypothetical protein
VAEPIYDDPEALNTMQELLLPGEELEAAFSRSEDSLGDQYSHQVTMLGITSRRLILKYQTKHGSGWDAMFWFASIPFLNVYQIQMNTQASFEILIDRPNQDGGNLGKLYA